jgi:ElaB/YqjD/DUF883 family membrane-anchored ribosome-binding protein
MENETEVIREQMLETRTALTEKLETLEEQVVAKVKGTTESLAETVETVKEAVENTAQTVERTVENTVETVKETFDMSRHFEEHPWLFVGGAVVAGYVGARLLDRVAPPQSLAASSRTPEPMAEPWPTGYHVQSASAEPARAGPSWGGELLHALRPALSKLGELAIGVTTGVIGEMVREQLPEAVQHDVGEVLDEITVALGGKPLHGFVSHEATQQPPAETESSIR